MRIYADSIETVQEEEGSGMDAALAGVTVGARVPASRTADSDPLVVVRRSGGLAQPPVLDRPRLDFMSWHQSDYLAMALASKVRALLLHDLKGQVVNGHTFYRVSEFAGPALYPDPAGSAVPIVMFTLETPVRVN
jgi:hypothetical protein